MVKAFVKTQSGEIEIFDEIDFRNREIETVDFEITNNFEVVFYCDPGARNIFLILTFNGKTYFSKEFYQTYTPKISLFQAFLVKNKIYPRGGMLGCYFIKEILEFLSTTSDGKFVSNGNSPRIFQEDGVISIGITLSSEIDISFVFLQPMPYYPKQITVNRKTINTSQTKSEDEIFRKIISLPPFVTFLLERERTKIREVKLCRYTLFIRNIIIFSFQ